MKKNVNVPMSEIASYAGGAGVYHSPAKPKIPLYLEETYWWAYTHPKAVDVFERQWLVNLILWGNFSRLRDKVLDDLGQNISGNTLQVACVYGDFSPCLAERLRPEASLDIVDVAPVQLDNVRKKIGQFSNVFVHHQDSSSLTFADNTYDNVVIFFLLHEQPEEVRRKTLAEAFRVVKPGGRILLMDYHRPHRFNPFYYVMHVVLRNLEPFALDLWRNEINEWFPPDCKPKQVEKQTFFGGLYQQLVITR